VLFPAHRQVAFDIAAGIVHEQNHQRPSTIARKSMHTAPRPQSLSRCFAKPVGDRWARVNPRGRLQVAAPSRQLATEENTHGRKSYVCEEDLSAVATSLETLGGVKDRAETMEIHEDAIQLASERDSGDSNEGTLAAPVQAALDGGNAQSRGRATGGATLSRPEPLHLGKTLTTQQICAAVGRDLSQVGPM
jgi:hypothetical protein